MGEEPAARPAIAGTGLRGLRLRQAAQTRLHPRRPGESDAASGIVLGAERPLEDDRAGGPGRPGRALPADAARRLEGVSDQQQGPLPPCGRDRSRLRGTERQDEKAADQAEDRLRQVLAAGGALAGLCARAFGTLTFVI